MSFEIPAAVTVTVKLRGKEITITRNQATDSVGRTIETPGETMRKAAGDAAAWIRRNR